MFIQTLLLVAVWFCNVLNMRTEGEAYMRVEGYIASKVGILILVRLACHTQQAPECFRFFSHLEVFQSFVNLSELSCVVSIIGFMV